MTKLKLSSRMHLMIIVSAVIVAIGLAMGLIFQFVSDGYFNYGSDYSSYKCVVVNYAYIDQQDKIEDVCEKAFKDADVNYYVCVTGDTEDGGRLVYKFSENANADNLKSATDAINNALSSENSSGLSNASYHSVKATLGGAHSLTYGAIAVATAIVFQFLYFAIRYKLTAAFAALLADVHNLAIFISLLAITRLPVGSTVFAFAALTVVMTMIGCCFLFDKFRNKAKDEDFAKLNTLEQSDVCANENIVNVAITAAVVAVAGILLFVLMSISALSVNLILTGAIMAVLSAVSCVYGTAFFTPSVYSRIKRIGDNYKASHSQKAKKS